MLTPSEMRELRVFAERLKGEKHEKRGGYDYKNVPYLTDDDREAQRMGELIEKAITMSDDYKTQLDAWLRKNGVHTIEEIQGTCHDVSDQFIEPESEMADVLRAQMEKGVVRLWDSTGYNDYFKVEVLRAFVKEHGRLSTWDSFEKLGEVPTVPEPAN